MTKRKDSKGRVLKDGESERKDGRYSYRYTGPDGKRKEIYAKDLNELRQKEKTILQEIQLGISNEKITLNECFERYMKAKTNIRESTAHQYTANYERWVKETWLGRKYVKDIKRTDILLFGKEKQNTLSGTTVKSIVGLIFSVLQMAVLDDLIAKNPANGCTRTILGGKPREAIPEDDLKKFLDYAESLNTGKNFLTLTKFLLGTGLRIGEAAGLTWKDVDLSNGLLEVNKQMSYTCGKLGKGFKVTPVKTESGNRVVPLSEDMVSLLKTHKNLTFFEGAGSGFTVDGYEGFVFHTSSGSPYTSSEVNAYYEKIARRYKKAHSDELPHVSCHLLRHTFCTRMAYAGMNPQALQYIMGHSNFSLTARAYISKDEHHASVEFKRVMRG